MVIQVFAPESRTTINWASGTSTELFIHPHDGSFADRNFQFRISTATVEAEESTFTHFAGITRHLMILKGEVELNHIGRYTKKLSIFERDTFSGEWETTSKGKVTDFNLMCKGDVKGQLIHIGLDEDELVAVKKLVDYCFLYVVSGVFVGEGVEVSAGDLIQIDGEIDEELELICKKDGDLIWIDVTL